ncbi:MAG: hypothetical protein F6K38_41980 [Moorea sp. SIO3B2]|nr:hypothetical protein [Moorena sp. SIO3B2]
MQRGLGGFPHERLHQDIEEKPLRGNLAACVDVLAGLRFEKDLVRRLLSE